MAQRRLASQLAAAREGRHTIATQRGTESEPTLAEGYAVAHDLERQLVNSGWHPIGWKLGFTNQALWGRLGLDKPIRARIYRETLHTSSVDVAQLVQPRIEPEIVVGLGRDVPTGADIHAIAEAIAWIAAGLEIVDCHFQRWSMTPAEAVADAGVHAALAVGPRTRAHGAHAHALGAAQCQLVYEGDVVAEGRGSDVLGDPLEALRWLLRDLEGGLRKDEIVTTGTMTEALPVEAGQRWEHRLSAAFAIEPIGLVLR